MMKSYVDDVFELCSTNQQSISNLQSINVSTNTRTRFLDVTKPILIMPPTEWPKELSEQEVKDFIKSLYSFDNLEGVTDLCQTQNILQDLLKSFKNSCSVDDSDFILDLPKYDSMVKTLIPKTLDDIPSFQSNYFAGLTDFLKEQIQGYSFFSSRFLFFYLCVCHLIFG